MGKLLQVNVTANSGSTGRIAEDIGLMAMAHGMESWIAYGRGEPQSKSNLIRIGDDWDMRLHGVESRILDNHGLASRNVTKTFIEKVRHIAPNIIHLHNIHGYFLNYKILFEFLREYGRPVVWTWHDIWPLTGHCAFFGKGGCDGWKYGCKKCHRKGVYPASWVMSRSSRNFDDKIKAFSSVPNLTIVAVSDWLGEMQRVSQLHGLDLRVIHNGIDLSRFDVQPMSESHAKYVIAVANVWTDDKGLNDLVKLREILPQDIEIKIVGLNPAQIKQMPSGIEGIGRTSNFDELKRLYSNAVALINPTWGDNFPTVNLEALACGTPVVTYRTGGSPEAIDRNTGIVVEQGDVVGMSNAVELIIGSDDKFSPAQCRRHAEKHFDKRKCFAAYMDLYEELLSK